MTQKNYKVENIVKKIIQDDIVHEDAEDTANLINIAESIGQIITIILITHWIFFWGRIDFCIESYWVIESSRIKYLQDSRPESFWYYSTMHGTRWKISRWKKRVYKRVIYYFLSRWKIIYLMVFSPKFLFLLAFVYKLIIYIYTFCCIEAALHKNDRFGARLEPAAVCRCHACSTLEIVILAVGSV